MLRSGERVRGGEPVRASGEAESHPRGRPALERGGNSPEGGPSLERGGNSPEGATSPRVRRNLTRGVDLPSSEAEPH
jgi:hypothetical protein